MDYLLNRFLTVATFHLRISRAVFGYTLMSPCICPRGRYSHTLPIRVCAAQRGRDFEAPDLIGVSISEAFSRTGYKKLWIAALSSA